ncbi:hypothetical protein BX788P2_00040 [Bacteroides phage BX788P2]|nr:hypothetical protein BX788P2_00040 [Bacteroides phage BX788P2]
MEKYSKAVSEMYSQFKKEAHPAEKYVGRLVKYRGVVLEVVGYSADPIWRGLLIADASLFGGWCDPEEDDVVFKRCEAYIYVNIINLID